MPFTRYTTAKNLNVTEKVLGGLFGIAGALVISKGEGLIEYADTIGKSIGVPLGIAAIVTGTLEQPVLEDEINKHWYATLSGFIPIFITGSIILALTTSDLDLRMEYSKNALF